ncbi:MULTISPECIES: hypothetical protein [unclassified Candidatus Accumulibacter]|jgi:hypothetical protein|uniref:hypothetical protein n=1 Tax=unclassified Candidatus Accumulibacter TaxID=2619054 RepID=UPI0012CA267B|nr:MULTISPECIES: hypothetical protein [unclassified Candidatus Accumulibacter]MQM32928.1 hypothetical protein [Candidatus Accumulibacter phosphatis]
MIKISKQADSLLLTYVPDGFDNGRGIDGKLRQEFWKMKRACLCFVQVALAQIVQQAVAQVSNQTDQEPA